MFSVRRDFLEFRCHTRLGHFCLNQTFVLDSPLCQIRESEDLIIALLSQIKGYSLEHLINPNRINGCSRENLRD